MPGPLTDFNIEQLRAVWDGLGYAWFEGELNLNIFGIRSAEQRAGVFDDAICCAWQESKQWRLMEWPATTDPGTYYLRNPINVEGTAIMVPGQYRGAYKLGLHRGKYDALVQKGAPVRVWRDGNRDHVLDWQSGTEGKSGWYGINIHRAGQKPKKEVARWSAGCQVFQDARDLEYLLKLARASSYKYGDRFTYTLITADALCALAGV